MPDYHSLGRLKPSTLLSTFWISRSWLTVNSTLPSGFSGSPLNSTCIYCPTEITYPKHCGGFLWNNKNIFGTKHQEVKLHQIFIQLFRRLIARGHPASNLWPLFWDAANPIYQEAKVKWIKSTTSGNGQHVFLHWQLHLNNILRCNMCNSYDQTCNASNAAQNTVTWTRHIRHAHKASIDHLLTAAQPSRPNHLIIFVSSFWSISLPYSCLTSKYIYVSSHVKYKNCKHIYLYFTTFFSGIFFSIVSNM